MADEIDPSEPVAAKEALRHSVPPRLKFIGVVALCIAGAVVVYGIGSRIHSGMRTEAWTEDQTVQNVQIIKLMAAKGGGDLLLPGDIQAFRSAPIHAQVSGVVQKWFVDIGARVKTGDILAQIDARPYQAALDAAKGQLARDTATLANVRTDLARYEALASQNAISAQTLSNQQALAAATAAIVESDRAAVEAAQINLEYTKLLAPFDGTVTSRAIDVGVLVNAGAVGAPPLFTITDQTRLRIYVRVPQIHYNVIKPDMIARFTVPEYPGRTFTARLAATTDVLQASSGTQLMQFQIDNEDGALRPGGYAEMRLPLPSGLGSLLVPATALIFRADGMMVATVGPGEKVVLKKIAIHLDMGSAVEVGSGLSPEDRVIDNPADSLRAGDPVRVTISRAAPIMAK